MIETKEQYEELQLMRLIPKHGPPVGKDTHKPVFETIEALRRFVRANDQVDAARINVLTTDLKGYEALQQEVTAARLALPDWIADD